MGGKRRVENRARQNESNGGERASSLFSATPNLEGERSSSKSKCDDQTTQEDPEKSNNEIIYESNMQMDGFGINLYKSKLAFTFFELHHDVNYGTKNGCKK